MPERAFGVLGDTLTKALIAGDFPLYHSIMVLPLKITPRDATAYVLSDEAALRDDFDLYHSIIKLHGVTDIYREVVAFSPAGPGQVMFHCTTHILVRANRLADPFATRMLLRQDADGWRIAEIESSEGHINWTLGRGAVSASGSFTVKE